jgi:acetyltransferase EpsM
MGHTVYQPSESLSESDPIIIAIGNNRIRWEKAHQLAKNEFGMARHPTAWVDSKVEVRPGTVIMPKAVVNTGTHIGEHSIINTGCVVEHDCQIDAIVHIAPNATVCGGCSIGEGTLVGAGAVVIPGIKIGKWCTIGAGAIVNQDVPDGLTVVGNPARKISVNDSK